MPIIVQGDNKSIHSRFLTTLMSNSDSLALSELWLCTISINSLRNIGDKILGQIGLYEDLTWSPRQDAINSAVLHPKNFANLTPLIGDTSVYMFARGITFISDGLQADRVGSNQVGALKGLTINGRLDMNAANITFLESNISFVDGFIRPWSVLVGHRSLKDGSLRCDIGLHSLEKWDLYEPLRVRKSMILKNAVPSNVDQEEMNYTGGNVMNRNVQFVFDRYQLYVNPEIEGTTIGTKKSDSALSSVLATATSAINKANGVLNDASTAIARGLTQIGMQDAANKVMDTNRKIQQKTTGPAAEILGTGASVVGGAELIANGVTGGSPKILNAAEIQRQITGQ